MELVDVVYRVDRRISDIGVELVRRVDALGSTESDIRQVHQHHGKILLRYFLLAGNVEDFEYFLI